MPPKPAKVVAKVRRGSILITLRETRGVFWFLSQVPGQPGQWRKCQSNNLDKLREKAKERADELARWDSGVVTVPRADWEALLAMRDEVAESRPVGEVRDAFLSEKHRMSDGSLRHYHTLRKFLARFCEAVGDGRRIGMIRHDEIAAWVDGGGVADGSEGAEGLSARSRLNRRNAVVTFFRWARERGELPDRKTEAERVPKPKVRSGRKVRVYSREEMVRLLSVVGERWLPSVLIGAFSGVRQEEMTTESGDAKPVLQWEDIRWESGVIRVRKEVAKVKRSRLVPMPENLQEWLLPYRKRTGAVGAGVSITKNETARLAKLGVKWRQNGLRHSYISARMAVVRDAARVANEAGNSPARVGADYDAVVTEAEGKAWFSIRPGDVKRIMKTTTKTKNGRKRA